MPLERVRVDDTFGVQAMMAVASLPIRCILLRLALDRVAAAVPNNVNVRWLANALELARSFVPATVNTNSCENFAIVASILTDFHAHL